MNKIIHEPTEVSDDSWRVKAGNWFLEGRKFRIQSRYIRRSALCVVMLLFAFELYSSFEPDISQDLERILVPDSANVNNASTYAPEIMTMDKAKAKDSLQKKHEVTRQWVVKAPVERIQAINLSNTSRGIPSGSEVRALLKSGGANGMVKVETTEPLVADGETLLPEHTVLMGQGTSSDDRLFIIFKKAITPDLAQVKIRALAFDIDDRVLGLKGKKISNYAFQLGIGSGLLFLGGMADGMRSDNSSNAFEKRRTTARDAALNGVTVATSDLSRDALEGMKNRQARVEVAHSTPIVIIFGDDDARE
jgi:hypothetical protein